MLNGKKIEPVIKTILKVVEPTNFPYEIPSLDITKQPHLNSRLVVISQRSVDGDSNVNAYENLENNDSNESHNLKHTLLRKISLLERPMNPLVAKVNITSHFIEIEHDMRLNEHDMSLNEFKSNLKKKETLKDIVDFTLSTLKEHPKIGYHRATISLIGENQSERKLLRHDDCDGLYKTNVLYYNQYQNPIGKEEENQDRLMDTVCKHGVFILPDILELRTSSQGNDWLKSIGWEDLEATIGHLEKSK